MKLSPASNPQRNSLILSVLLVAIIVAIYYPALFNRFHLIDDPGIYAKYSASPSLSSILRPGNGYYYRPLIELSFWFDNLLWGMEPSMMHLENIILHCVNSLLVFMLARRVSRDNFVSIIPFFAALLFALHPVNVEAVTWIAGRTDPLLAMFVLSACIFWLDWLDRPCWKDICGALLMFCAALLTKETALAFVAVAALFGAVWPGAATGRQRLMALTGTVIPFVLLVTITVVLNGKTSALSRFFSVTEIHTSKIAQDWLIALGFYVRKLIVPFPLNFALVEVHQLHALLIVPLVVLLWLMLRRYKLSVYFFVSALLMLLPALLVVMKPISWTPFAERYLYLPTAFLALGLVGICDVWHKKYSVIQIILMLLLLCGFGISDYQRNVLWGNPLAFFQDAVTKSPEFGSLYHSLGGIFMQNGNIEQAAEAFITADRLNKRDSMYYPIKASIMGTMLARGNYAGARRFFFELFKDKKSAPSDFLELLYKTDSKRLESVEQQEKVALVEDLLETLSLLNQQNPDPFRLYQSAKIALVVGNVNLATDLFRKAYNAAPMNAHYKAAAKTYYMRLETEK